MARLILESGGERREYAVHETITLGRGKAATVQLEDKLLSREHTRVSLDRHPDGSVTFSVRDMGSKNGTAPGFVEFACCVGARSF